MTDLLLITDVPRLRKIFSRLTDAKNIHLRVANNLEKGAEELTAEKPAIVFVQTHLSGLSAEIILMHLKKQLGRKRTRFVLLAAADQVSNDTLRIYQGHIDTALEDEPLLASIRETVAALVAKPPKKVVQESQVSEPVMEHVPAVMPEPPRSETVPVPAGEEPSLEEQGITYSPRPRMSVYSEFNSSFDSAVGNMKPAATVNEIVPEQHNDWSAADIETVETTPPRSKQASFMLWLAPVIIAVVVVTILQQKRSPSTPPAATVAPPATASKATVQPIVSAEAAKPVTAPVVATAPVPPQQPAVAKTVREPDAALSDKAVLSAIAENRGKKEQAAKPAATTRPTALPDFIPRYAVDKTYAAANPGWERYKGQVTEFKVFREGGAIKAIQVIDKGGSGVPESFMKAAMRQVSKNPSVVVESTEKKEGYEIQRGQTGDNLKVMFYRDDQGGKLRAFVMTWK